MQTISRNKTKDVEPSSSTKAFFAISDVSTDLKRAHRTGLSSGENISQFVSRDQGSAIMLGSLD